MPGGLINPFAIVDSIEGIYKFLKAKKMKKAKVTSAGLLFGFAVYNIHGLAIVLGLLFLHISSVV